MGGVTLPSEAGTVMARVRAGWGKRETCATLLSSQREANTESSVSHDKGGGRCGCPERGGRQRREGESKGASAAGEEELSECAPRWRQTPRHREAWQTVFERGR
jgi:hypothetical protein